jgi:hypothetical protein
LGALWLTVAALCCCVTSRDDVRRALLVGNPVTVVDVDQLTKEIGALDRVGIGERRWFATIGDDPGAA